MYAPGMDVTVNWKAWDIKNTNDLFYTDANALEIIRRTTNDYPRRTHTTTTQLASSNFYPVNSALMIEDV
jgi:hypothetical protein